MCVRVRSRARARARVCVCVRVRACVDVAKLKDETICSELQDGMADALATDDSDHWEQFKTTVSGVASKVLGFRKTCHKDWFDDQDTEALKLLDDMHTKHLCWMNDKTSSFKKSAYTAARSAAQKRLRQMKDDNARQGSYRMQLIDMI